MTLPRRTGFGFGHDRIMIALIGTMLIVLCLIWAFILLGYTF